MEGVFERMDAKLRVEVVGVGVHGIGRPVQEQSCALFPTALGHRPQDSDLGVREAGAGRRWLGLAERVQGSFNGGRSDEAPARSRPLDRGEQLAAVEREQKKGGGGGVERRESQRSVSLLGEENEAGRAMGLLQPAGPFDATGPGRPEGRQEDAHAGRAGWRIVRPRLVVGRKREVERANRLGKTAVGVKAPALRCGHFGDEVADGLVVVNERDAEGRRLAALEGAG